MKRFQFIFAIFAIIFALTAVEKISATGFRVTNTNDSGAGSLRQAILDSNVNNEDDAIVFDATLFSTPQTIVLTSGQLAIEADRSSGTTKTVTIDGPGANLLTISGNNQSRVIMLDEYARAVISGIKITGGNGTGGTGFQNWGGGLLVKGGYNGDGVRNLVLRNSIITGNKVANPGIGGGAFLGWYVEVINTTISNNEAPTAGGGVETGSSSHVWFVNSTISGNRGGRGGGINNNGGTLYLINSTIAFNWAEGGGGGVLLDYPGQYGNSVGFMRNTIVAKNTTDSVSGDYADARGAFYSLGYNIIGDTRGMLFLTSTNQTGNQLNVDPQLDHQLRTNEGVMPTHALRANSPAIDAGDNCVVSASCAEQNVANIPYDLRGIARAQDGDGNGTATVDIGAFEATRAEIVIAPTGAPDLRAANDTGASSADNITSSSTLTFDLTGLMTGATVELLRDGIVAATTTAGGNSAVLTDTGVTANGVHVYTTRQIIDNIASLQGPALAVTIDNAAPTVTLNQASWQVDPTNAQPINYTVTFSEAVAGFEAADVSLAGSTAGASTATVAISGSGSAYTIGVINLSADGTVVAAIPQGAGQDVAGNSSQASTSTDNTVTYDATRPTVTINQAATQTEPTRNVPVNFTVVFSEPVTGFTAADVSLAGSTANVSSANITVTGSGATYNVAVSGIFSNGGFVRASVTASAALDAAGNQSLASTSTDNEVIIDNASPTVTINQAAGQSDPANTLPINFTVVFNEAVTGFDAADLFFTGSSISTGAATVAVTGSGTTYNVAVGNINSNGGTLRVTVRANAASDALGNLSFASTSTDNQVSFDNIAPTVSINQAIGQSDPASAQPVNFTVVFNELVTGFTAADVSLAGSTANVSSANIIVTGSGSVYTVAVSNITSGGQVRAGVIAGAAQDSFGNPSAASSSTDNTITVNVKSAAFDFDGDGKADVSVFRPSDGTWYLNRSTQGFNAVQFGISTDIIAPADFDGDGKTDIAVFRDNTWYLNRTSAGFTAVQFGAAGDIPQPADFNGDGKAEVAVFRPSDGAWYMLNLQNNQFSSVQFGANNDKPVAADYDGDGKADYAVFRPADGTWYLLRSRDGFTGVQFGISTDKPVVGDYDGDGKADLAVYRDGVWYQLRSSQGFVAVQFGIASDLPAPADYDGDGKTDPAVYRDNTWYLLQSTQGFTGLQFGAAGDKPVANAFVQ